MPAASQQPNHVQESMCLKYEDAQHGVTIQVCHEHLGHAYGEDSYQSESTACGHAYLDPV